VKTTATKLIHKMHPDNAISIDRTPLVGNSPKGEQNVQCSDSGSEANTSSVILLLRLCISNVI
jgi:hypothetical protein